MFLLMSLIISIVVQNTLSYSGSDLTGNVYIGKICSNKHVKDSLKGVAPCIARDKVIPVPWPNNTDIHQLSPSHVVVKRCSGGCHTSDKSCVASVTRVRHVSVMMGRCPVGGGKCDKQCASLEVEDEVECVCGCSKHLQQQCDQRHESHTWSSESCECQCKDQEARRQCLETPGKVWDSSSCTCICQAPETCHTGLIYNSATCMCEPTATISSEEASAVVRGDRDSSEDTNFIYNYIHQHWIELIIIIILATIIVFLCIIIAALMRRIHILRTVISNTKSSHVKVAQNLYSPCPIPSFESQSRRNQASPPIIRPDTQLDNKNSCNKMLDLYSGHSSDSEISSERQTDCSYYTDTSLTLTPPPPCQCFSSRPLDGISECSTLLGRETNV